MPAPRPLAAALACTAASLALVPAAHAYWEPQPLAVTTAGHLAAPKVGVDAAGDYLVVWRDEDEFSLKVRRVGADGALGVVQTLSNPAQGQVGAFDLDVADDGAAIVVWVQGPFDMQTTRARVVNADDTLLALDTLSADPRASKPSVSVDASGQGVAAWQRRKAGVNRIEARKINTAGEKSGLYLLSDGPPASVNPDVAARPGGDAIVAYTNKSPAQPLARIVPVAGAPGPEIELDVGAEAGIEPQAVARPDGSFVVAYVQGVAGPNEALIMRTVSAGGVASNAVTFSDPGADADTPGLGVAADGTTTIVWRYRSGPGEPFQAQLRRLAPDDALGPVVPGISDPVAELNGLALAVDPSGVAVATWAQPAPRSEVLARRVAADGTLEPLQTVVAATTENPREAVGPAVAASTGDRALVAVLRNGPGFPTEDIEAYRHLPGSPPDGSGGGAAPGGGAVPGTGDGGGASGPLGRDLVAPVISRLRVDRRRRVRFRVSEPVTATIVVRRVRRGRRPVRVARLTRAVARAGAVRVRLPRRVRRRAGRYRVAVTAVDLAGNRTRRASRRSFRLARRAR